MIINTAERANRAAMSRLSRPVAAPPSTSGDELDMLVSMWKEEDAASGKPVLDDDQYGYAATDLLQGEDFGDDGRQRLVRFQQWKKARGLKPKPHRVMM